MGWETGQRDDQLNRKLIDQGIGAFTTEPVCHGRQEGVLGFQHLNLNFQNCKVGLIMSISLIKQDYHEDQMKKHLEEYENLCDCQMSLLSYLTGRKRIYASPRFSQLALVWIDLSL